MADQLPSPAETLDEKRARLQQLRDHEAEIEALEQQRAQTPLALKLELVSCEYCSVKWPANTTIPEYSFDTIACPFKKSRPDQDCRDCSHVRFIPYGAHFAPHEKRYQAHGMVIPVASEEHSDAIASVLHDLDARPLRRVQYEIVELERQVAREEYVTAQAKQMADEAQQRGPHVG